MQDKLQQTIKEEIEKLPKEGQEAINVLDWVKTTEEIGKKYLLDESEVNNLQVETLLVLVGLADPEFYVTNIENQVGTIKDDATKIANEVLEKIFTPINNIFIENIKKNGKDKNPNAEQTLNFILSGGDYSAFVPKSENQVSETPVINKILTPSVTPPTLADIKANMHPSSRAMTDINPVVKLSQSSTTGVKSKFVI